MNKIFEWIGIVALIAIITYAGSYIAATCIDAAYHRSEPVNIQVFKDEIEEFRQIAREAETEAAASDKKAEAAETAQQQAEAEAAGKDTAMEEKDSEIAALKTVVEKLEKDSPCGSVEVDELNFEDAKLAIMSLCRIGAIQKQTIFTLEEKDKLSTGKIDNLKTAITACDVKAAAYMVSRDKLRVSVAAQRNALNKYEFEVVPALEKELKKKRRRSFWKKMKYYLVGAAFGGAAVLAAK